MKRKLANTKQNGARPAPNKRRRVVKKRRNVRVQRGGILGNLPRLYKLRYCDWFQLSSSSGAMATYSFRANGIYDPNQSSTGHQPFLYDTLATLWDRYIVVGAKITIKALGIETGSTSTQVGALGIVLDDDNTISTTYTTVVEQSMGRHRILNSRADVKPSTVVSTFGAKKFFGFKDVKDNVEAYGANFGADPTRQAYFVCWLQSFNTSDSVAVNCVATIDYIVYCMEPKSLAQS